VGSFVWEKRKLHAHDVAYESITLPSTLPFLVAHYKRLLPQQVTWSQIIEIEEFLLSTDRSKHATDWKVLPFEEYKHPSIKYLTKPNFRIGMDIQMRPANKIQRLVNPQLATYLLGQIGEEFGQGVAGFKTILQQRTKILKKTTDLYATSMVLTWISMCRIWKIYHLCLNTSHRGVAGFGGSHMGAAGFLTLDLTSRMAASEPSGSQLP
jgi:hypothetical protein